MCMVPSSHYLMAASVCTSMHELVMVNLTAETGTQISVLFYGLCQYPTPEPGCNPCTLQCRARQGTTTLTLTLMGLGLRIQV